MSKLLMFSSAYFVSFPVTHELRAAEDEKIGQHIFNRLNKADERTLDPQNTLLMVRQPIPESERKV
jgi:hypothetical protein